MGMTACAALSQREPLKSSSHRVLRWRFTRGDGVVDCELGLDAAAATYELRICAPGERSSVETFVDAISAFHRQSAVERRLVADGWCLESYGSSPPEP